ncbi:MAG: PatB family C-S lyase [Rhodobacter sp.]|nr:PatB family C-S lyase [Rhodobacter sp.]
MDFEPIKDRSGRHATKWDSMQAFCGLTPDSAIAMWVADMDFDAAPCIKAALQGEIDNGFLGYFGNPGPVNDAICTWMAERHGWQVQPEWLRYSHGVVSGFAMVLEAFSDPGDAIILFTPVYHAFFTKARAMDREILQSRLELRDGQYHMDLDALAGRLTGRERIVTLCSPHNPGGRLWTADELRELAEFCDTHDLILCSDEIHMDLAFPGARHIPTATAAPGATPRLVTITAASKGFNIAGGETGFAIIEDTDLRARFDAAHKKMGGTPNRFGMLMTKAAFTEGADWSEAVRAYLAGNFALWRDRIGALPGVAVMDMACTYLTWVDFSGTGMPPEETTARLHGAGIAMSPGAQFGDGGENWHRFNIAMPRPLLEQAVARVESAFSDLQ